MSGNDITWTPSKRHLSDSNVAKFLEKYGFDDYDQSRPTTERETAVFWDAIVDDLNVAWMDPYDEVLDTSAGTPFTDWFPGGTLNLVETAIDRWADRTPEADVYRWANERGETVEVTYAELGERVDRMAGALRNQGVERGDRIGIVYPFHPNGFAAAFAAMRIGAAFVPVFPGYGRTALAQRIDDSGASFVFTTDGYYRDGEVVELHEKLDGALERTLVEQLIVEEYVGVEPDNPTVPSTSLEAFLDQGAPVKESAEMAAGDTAMIAYSSGTTGKPKGTIHTHASLLVMGMKEAAYHFDLSRGDTQLWTTDFGWIIVPLWMMSGAPALGATTVLLEGAPTTPDEDRVWRAIERHDVTLFGTSPSGARGFRRATEAPRSMYDLDSLEVLASTGEPWDEDAWEWYFDAVGDRECPIINASGGTEFCGAILSPTPVTPLKPGTLYGPAPGVPAAIYDEDGEPSTEGYLVVEGPVPGMTHGLTDGDDRYLEEYWSDFEGVWNQNDWAVVDDDGFWFVVGRADDTMNVAGRRISAPEIEAAVGNVEGVTGSVVVPVPDERRGEVPVAFVTVDDRVADPDDLPAAIEAQVDDRLGAPFRPVAVHVVPAIPRTQTEKVPRKVIRSAYLGEPPEDVLTLVNGEALHEYPVAEERD